MKYLGIAFCLFCLWGISSGVSKPFFKLQDCSKNNHSIIAFVDHILLNPDPVILKRGNVTASVKIRITEPVPQDAKMKVRFYKEKSILGIRIDIPIPCLLGKFGSCTLPVCKYLEHFREQAEPFFPEGTEYGCPLNAGTYGGDDVNVKIPDLGIFARLLVSGKYRVEIEVVSQKEVLICYKVWAEVK